MNRLAGTLILIMGTAVMIAVCAVGVFTRHEPLTFIGFGLIAGYGIGAIFGLGVGHAAGTASQRKQNRTLFDSL